MTVTVLHRSAQDYGLLETDPKDRAGRGRAQLRLVTTFDRNEQNSRGREPTGR